MNEDRLARIEEMLATLIQMVGATNAKLKDHDQRFDQLENNFKEEKELRQNRHEEMIKTLGHELDIVWKKETDIERDLERMKKLIGF